MRRDEQGGGGSLCVTRLRANVIPRDCIPVLFLAIKLGFAKQTSIMLAKAVFARSGRPRKTLAAPNAYTSVVPCVRSVDST